MLVTVLGAAVSRRGRRKGISRRIKLSVAQADSLRSSVNYEVGQAIVLTRAAGESPAPPHPVQSDASAPKQGCREAPRPPDRWGQTKRSSACPRRQQGAKYRSHSRYTLAR